MGIALKATLYESACFVCALLIHAIMHKPLLIELDIHVYYVQLGISNDSHVIVYDNNETFGMFSAARLWWMFKVSHNACTADIAHLLKFYLLCIYLYFNFLNRYLLVFTL